MRIFAIGDLHLSFGVDKPMDLFGPQWSDHASRLRTAWEASVSAEDLVLIPGDISWSIDLAGAKPDLDFIGSLPGTKLMLRGNHDYWWASLTQIRRNVNETVKLLQNDAFSFGDYAIGGSRGWVMTLPDAEESQDKHIYEREVMRLEMSLKRMEPGKRKIVMTHFPPLDHTHKDTPVTELLERYGVETVIYAHLHGAAHKGAFQGEHNGIRYLLASSDYLRFQPLLIAEGESKTE